jgi:hypothetical protein
LGNFILKNHPISFGVVYRFLEKLFGSPGLRRRMVVLFYPSAVFFAQGNAGQNEDDDAQDTEILFVFDASNSMNAFWDGNRKIEVATRLLSESLEELYGIPGLELALRVYGHQTKFIEGKQDCDDTELVIPFARGNNLLIRKALSRLTSTGNYSHRSILAARSRGFFEREQPKGHHPHNRWH